MPALVKGVRVWQPIWRKYDAAHPNVAYFLDACTLRGIQLVDTVLYAIALCLRCLFPSPDGRGLQDRLTDRDPHAQIAVRARFTAGPDGRFKLTRSAELDAYECQVWLSRLLRAMPDFIAAVLWIVVPLLAASAVAFIVRDERILRLLLRGSTSQYRYHHINVSPIEPLSRPIDMLGFTHAFWRAQPSSSSTAAAFDEAIKANIVSKIAPSRGYVELGTQVTEDGLEDADGNGRPDVWERAQRHLQLREIQMRRDREYAAAKRGTAGSGADLYEMADGDSDGGGASGGYYGITAGVNALGFLRDSAVDLFFKFYDPTAYSRVDTGSAGLTPERAIDEAEERRLTAIERELALSEPGHPLYRVCERSMRYNPSEFIMGDVNLCWDQVLYLIDRQFNVEWFSTQTQRSMSRDPAQTRILTLEDQDALFNAGRAKTTGALQQQYNRASAARFTTDDADDDNAGPGGGPGSALTCINNLHLGFAEPFVIMNYPGAPSRLYLDPELVEFSEPYTTTARRAPVHTSAREFTTAVKRKFSLDDHQQWSRARDARLASVGANSNTLADDDREYASNHLHALNAAGNGASERDLEQVQMMREGSVERRKFRMNHDRAPRVWRADDLLYRVLNYSRLVEYPHRVRIAYKTLPAADDMIRYFGTLLGDTYAAMRDAADEQEFDLFQARTNTSFLDWIGTRAIDSLTPAEFRQAQARALLISYNRRFEVFMNKTNQCRRKRIDLEKTDGNWPLSTSLKQLINPLATIWEAAQNVAAADDDDADAADRHDDTPAECTDRVLNMPRLLQIRGEHMREPDELRCFAKTIAMNQMMRQRRHDYALSHVFMDPAAHDPMETTAYVKGITPLPARREYVYLAEGSHSRSTVGQTSNGDNRASNRRPSLI